MEARLVQRFFCNLARLCLHMYAYCCVMAGRHLVAFCVRIQNILVGDCVVVTPLTCVKAVVSVQM